jgi:hypothetical protein
VTSLDRDETGVVHVDVRSARYRSWYAEWRPLVGHFVTNTDTSGTRTGEETRRQARTAASSMLDNRPYVNQIKQMR